MAKADAKTKKVKRPTALKRDLQNERRRARNRTVRSTVKTAIRNYETSLQEKDNTSAQANLAAAYSVIDKAVKKGVFTKNKGNRSKARLAAKVKVA